MISFPFDSQITGTDPSGLPIYDRASSSDELARLLHSFFTNGIFGGSGFAVTVSGRTVRVAPGSGLIQGRYCYEPDTRTFTLEAGGNLPRIDTIVLRLDLSLDGRNIDLYLRKGEELSTPEPLGMVRNETTWELGIANIYVAAKATNVNQSAVTDTRLYTVRCGLVTQAIKTIDTTTFYDQIAADMAEFKAREQAAFEAWFEDVQTVLGEDAAGQLLNRINERVSKNGDTMSGSLIVDGGENATSVSVRRSVHGDDCLAQMMVNSDGFADVVYRKNGVVANRMSLKDDRVTFSTPVDVSSGGTGANTADGALASLGALAKISAAAYTAALDANNTTGGSVTFRKWHNLVIVTVRELTMASTATGAYTSFAIAHGLPAAFGTTYSASLTRDGDNYSNDILSMNANGTTLYLMARNTSAARGIFHGQFIYLTNS